MWGISARLDPTFELFKYALSVLSCVLLLGTTAPAYAFEFQRMLLLPQSITIGGGAGESKILRSRCLDEYRPAPPSTGKYTYMMPSFGKVSVRIGKKTMSLQQAIANGKLEISGLGAAGTLDVKKLVPDKVTISVDQPAVITEGKHDDAQELLPFLTAHQKDWAAEPMAEIATDPVTMEKEADRLQKKQRDLWSERRSAMRADLERLGLSDFVKTEDQRIAQDQSIAKRKQFFREVFGEEFAQDFVAHAESEFLAAADYAAVASKAAARYGDKAPIVVQVFPAGEFAKGAFGIAFLPNGKSVLLKSADAADRLMESRQSEAPKAGILVNGPSTQRPSYQALELSLRSALAQQSIGATEDTPVLVGSGGGAGGGGGVELFPSFSDLPPNRGGKLLFAKNEKELVPVATKGAGGNNPPPKSPKAGSNLGPGSYSAPLFLSVASRAKTVIQAKVRSWVLQFSSRSVWAVALAASLGTATIESGDDGEDAEERREIFGDMTDVVKSFLDDQLGPAGRSEIEISGRYGVDELFARRVVDKNSPYSPIKLSRFRGSKWP